MSFYLVRLEPDGNGGMRDVPLPDHDPYEKGSDAAKAAKTLTDQLGYKVQPRRMAQAPDWRARQQERLASGQLKKLPEAWDLEPIKDHFAHLSARDPSKIAYTESEELGTIDRVTITTPGRYLTKFYPEVDDGHRRRLIAAVDPAGEVHFAFNPEEIVDIYKNGPSSCMDARHTFSGMEPHWPTEPYGAGDLAIAYTRNAEGRIQSRCLCWPEKKLFGRCYGDIERMIAAMKAEGYTYLRADEHPFPSGAKLLKIPHPTREGSFVMPYFDDIEMVVLKDDHFETYDGLLKDIGLGSKYIVCGGSQGYSELFQYCPKLRQGRPARSFQFVHGAEQEWSKEAIDAHAFTCRGSGKVWSNDFRVRMATPGVYWSVEHFDQFGEHCQVTQKNHPASEMVQKGNRRVHLSVSYRLDDEGNEVKIIEPRRYSPSLRDLKMRDMIEADRNPWIRGMKYRDIPTSNRDRLVYGFDPAVPGGDETVTVTTSNVGITGRSADMVLIDDLHTNAQVDPRQVEQMARWMNDMVDRRMLEGAFPEEPRRYDERPRRYGNNF